MRKAQLQQEISGRSSNSTFKLELKLTVAQILEWKLRRKKFVAESDSTIPLLSIKEDRLELASIELLQCERAGNTRMLIILLL